MKFVKVFSLERFPLYGINLVLGEFRQETILPPVLIGKKFITLTFCPVSMIDMATMTALAKNLSMHQNTKVAGLGKIKNFHVHSKLYQEYISNIFLIILRKSYA